MNPFDGLSADALTTIGTCALVGIVILVVMACGDFDKARRAATVKVAAPVMKTTFVWMTCPNGHAKVLGDHNWSCPVCGAEMRSVESVFIHIESGKFIGAGNLVEVAR